MLRLALDLNVDQDPSVDAVASPDLDEGVCQSVVVVGYMDYAWGVVSGTTER
jgi:hypothetical protein